MTWSYFLHRRYSMSRQKNSILTNEHALNRECRHCTSTYQYMRTRYCRTSTANNIFQWGTPIAGTKWSIPSIRSCSMAFQWNRDLMIGQPLNMESRIQIPEMETDPESNNFIKRKIKKQSSHSIIWSIEIKSPVQKEFVFEILYKSIRSSHDGVQAHAKIEYRDSSWRHCLHFCSLA